MDAREFTEQMKEDIDRFAMYWAQQRREHPDRFSAEMGITDWFEQFEMWLAHADEEP